MCLPIDSCFGFGAPRTDDDLGPPNKQHVPPPSRPPRNGGGHYHNGTSYAAQGTAASAEANRKASNDVRKGPTPAHAVPMGTGAARDWHGGHAATGAQEKAAAVYPHAGADATLKQQPAAPNGGVAQHMHNYYHHEREQPAAHKQDAADFHYPAAASATADHER